MDRTAPLTNGALYGSTRDRSEYARGAPGQRHRPGVRPVGESADHSARPLPSSGRQDRRALDLRLLQTVLPASGRIANPCRRRLHRRHHPRWRSQRCLRRGPVVTRCGGAYLRFGCFFQFLTGACATRPKWCTGVTLRHDGRARTRRARPGRRGRRQVRPPGRRPRRPHICHAGPLVRAEADRGRQQHGARSGHSEDQCSGVRRPYRRYGDGVPRGRRRIGTAADRTGWAGEDEGDCVGRLPLCPRRLPCGRSVPS